MIRTQSGFSHVNTLRASMPAVAAHPQQNSQGLAPPHNADALCRPEWFYLAEQIKDGVLQPAGKLTQQEITDLAAYLATSPAGLDALKVSWQPKGKALAAHIAQALEVNSRLSSLELSCSYIDAEDLARLANVLKINTCLKSLDLGGNETEAAGAKTLADSLEVNTTLNTLKLNICAIGADGTRCIANMLKINSGLTSLSFDGNDIRPAGVGFLAEALKVNRSLTSLTLCHNKIDADDVALLADALKVNRSLTSLDLSHNEIDIDGVALLADALKINTCLNSLNLSFNRIETAGRIALREALACNKTLRTISISNWIAPDRSDTSRAQVHQAVSDNRKLWACLPLASVGLELASGLAYPTEVMQIILKEMIFSPDIPKQVTLDTIIGLHDSLCPPV
jgi:hypothetical protein